MTQKNANPRMVIPDSGGFELLPEGVHIARCYQIIHLGTRTKEHPKWGTRARNEIRITWEVPGEMRVFDEDKGEQPMVISRSFTFTKSRKGHFVSFLESWRGKSFSEKELESFDVVNLLGQPCLLNIVHAEASNGNTYANISSISPPLKDSKVPKGINPQVWYTPIAHDQEVFDTLPEWMQEEIEDSDEYKEFVEGAGSEESEPETEETNELPWDENKPSF